MRFCISGVFFNTKRLNIQSVSFKKQLNMSVVNASVSVSVSVLFL